MKLRWIALIFIVAWALFSTTVYAHSGRTDGNGGHTNHSTGEYHYHHGHSAHQHYDMDDDGDADCPYNFDDNTIHKNDNPINSESASGIGNGKQNNKLTFGDVFFAVLSTILVSYVAYCAILIVCAIVNSLIERLAKRKIDFFASNVFTKVVLILSIIIGVIISISKYILMW